MAISKFIQPGQSPPLSPSQVMKDDVMVKTMTNNTAPSLPHDEHVVLTEKKRVVFAESYNIEYANTMMSAEECKNLWYTSLDFQRTKEHAHQFAKQAFAQDKLREDDEQSYSNIILRVYGECCEAESEPSQHECDNGTGSNSDSILEEQDENDFIFLIGKANSRSGLERVIVRDVACDKRYRRQEIVLQVLKVQYQCRGTCSYYSMSELIRSSCEALSRPSRLFARQLGSALKASMVDF